MTNHTIAHDPTTLRADADPLESYLPAVVHIPLADEAFTATNLADFDTDESAVDELARLSAQRDAMLAAAVAELPDLDDLASNI